MELRKRILRGGKGEKEREKERRIRGETEHERATGCQLLSLFSSGLAWGQVKSTISNT